VGSFDQDYWKARSGNVSATPSQGEWAAINDMRREREARAAADRASAEQMYGSAGAVHPPGSPTSGSSYPSAPSAPATLGGMARAFAVVGAVLVGIWALWVADMPWGNAAAYSAVAAAAGAAAGAALYVALKILALCLQVLVWAALGVTALHLLGVVDGWQVLNQVGGQLSQWLR